MIGIGPLIRTLAKKGFTLEQFCEFSNIPIKKIDAITRGKLSVELLTEICEKLDCQPCEVINANGFITKTNWHYLNECKPDTKGKYLVALRKEGGNTLDVQHSDDFSYNVYAWADLSVPDELI